MEKEALAEALRDISQMVEVAIRASDSLNGVGDNTIFQCPSDDANLLAFAIFDLQKRVKDLQAAL